MMIRRFAPIALASLALTLTACGGGTVPEGGSSTKVSGDGVIVSLTTPSGLDCDVFDTYKGGTVDCNFDAFTVPSDWKPGVVDSVKAADGEVVVAYFKDGHYCATFDGFESAGIACSYPKR